MTATSNFHHDSPMTYPYTDPPMNSGLIGKFIGIPWKKIEKHTVY